MEFNILAQAIKEVTRLSSANKTIFFTGVALTLIVIFLLVLHESLKGQYERKNQKA